MLTENQLQALPQALHDSFKQLEQDIIKRIANRIKVIGELAESDVYRLDELRRVGFDLDEIQREVAKTVAKSLNEIRTIFEDASEIEYRGTKINFDLNGKKFVPFRENAQLQTLIESIRKAACDDLLNMSHTLAFVNARSPKGILVPGGVTQSIADYYRSVIDYASLRIRTGQAGFDSAMRATIRTMADMGLRTVNYESGYSRRLDTAIRANLMDAQSRLSMAQAELVGAQFGADGYEVSWHSGARPSHVWIGGIQVSTKTFNQRVRPVMEEPNCYHRAFPIINGISPPTYTRSELDLMNANDARAREYKGKDYNAYTAQQRQREMETEIRKQKDRAMAFTEAGSREDAMTARARARALQAEYKRFSAAMAIPTKPARTRVAGYH